MKWFGRLGTALGRPIACGVVAIACWTGVTLERLDDYDWKPSSFIVAGTNFVEPSKLAAPIALGVNEGGYDGQFYYRLALDPFSPEHVEYGIRLDTPHYRHQRIGFPLLVWLFSLGQPAAVASMMVVVNLMMIFGLGWMGGEVARRFELHPQWGLIIPLYAGFQFTLFRDLVEVAQATFILGGLLLLGSRRPLAAAAALSYATLCKETAVIVPVALAIAWFWYPERRADSGVRWWVAGIPLAVFGGWQWYIYERWGQFAASGGQSNLGSPLRGIIDFVGSIIVRETHLQRVFLREIVVIVVLAGLTTVALRWSRAGIHIRVAWLLYGALASVLTTAVWVEDWAFMRAVSELHLLAALIVLGSPRWIRLPFAVLTVALWLYTAYGMMTGR